MITVFDFDTDWDQITPLLGNDMVVRALNAGMTDYCEQNELTWVPEDGPCAYADPEWDPMPTEGGPDWYRCDGAAVGIGLWNCALGELLYPDLSWSVIEDSTHTIGIGIGIDSTDMVYMDILQCWDKTAEEIWELIKDGTFKSLMHEIIRIEAPNE
jgi:hypothetical protein